MSKLGDRFNVGKSRWDLVPWGPLSELVNVYTYGSKKYADNNWRKGLKFSDTFAALQRHLMAWYSGESRDSESNCHHLAHVAWNAFTLIELEFLGKGVDDRVKDAMPLAPVSLIKEPPKRNPIEEVIPF